MPRKKRRTQKEIGRELLSNDNAKYDATLDGVRPRKGLYLFHPTRKKVYGKIVKVHRNGDVSWEGKLGGVTRTESYKLIDGGYRYHDRSKKDKL